MGRKKKEKGFLRFNLGRLIKSVIAAVVLTGIMTAVLWSNYQCIFEQSYGSRLETDSMITSLDLLAYAILEDESFLKDALSGPVAYDYVSFQEFFDKDEVFYDDTTYVEREAVYNPGHNDVENTETIYETEYTEVVPELEGSKADYNTRFLVLDRLFEDNDFIASKLRSGLKIPEYNSKPVEYRPWLDYRRKQNFTAPVCRAVNELYARNSKSNISLNEFYVDPDKINSELCHEYRGYLYIDDRMFEYDLIVNHKSFQDVFGVPIICGFAVVLFLCLTVGCLMGLRKYHKYQAEMNNIRFRNGLIDALAHNLKTPMQIITVNAENLKDRPSAERKKKYTANILSRTEVMNDMISSISEAAERPPVESLFGVKDAVVEAADKLGVKPEISDDTKIKADREFFIQAVYNLIDNAVRYGLEGYPVKVEIKAGKMIISNHSKSDKYTPGTGLAIADRFLTRCGMLLSLELKDGVFKAVIEFGFY